MPAFLPLLFLGGLAALAGLSTRTKNTLVASRKFFPGPRLLSLSHGRTVWTWVPTSPSSPTLLCLHGHGGKVTTLGPALVPLFQSVRHPPLVIMPQMGPLSEPGELDSENGMRTLVRDVYDALGSTSAPGAAPHPLPATVDVCAHSGGFVAAAAVISRGGIPVPNLGLLDSLYGLENVFEAFALRPGTHHFLNVYGPSTERLSQALALKLIKELGPGKAVLDEGGITAFSKKAATISAGSATHDKIPEVFGAAMLNAFHP